VKEVTQRLRDGRVEVIELPDPVLSPDGVLVDVRASLVSAGTERSKISTGRKNLVAKARARPDQVRQVMDKLRRDGAAETIRAVRARLDQPSPLGYSAAGVVLEVGDRVRDLAPGQRVACGGADYAVHAEVDHVPANLCVPLPESLSFAEGAFATVGAIALHGVRQADVRLGERVAVVGLGLVGQLAAQLLRASGCHVVGIELSPALLELATATGACDVAIERDRIDGAGAPVEVAGCDAVIITAATPSSDPVRLAATLCRDRGRVVVVGDVGMELPRADYYGKELELRLSRSYGPGRYDRDYEERGLDYPIGYVRWTERRNMGAFLEQVATRRVDVEPLISERYPVEAAPDAYERLLQPGASPLGIVLEYEPTPVSAAPTPRAAANRPRAPLAVGLIGAGSFAQGTIVPALQAAGFQLSAVAGASGRSAHAARERFGFERESSPTEVLSDPEIGTVVIATRHATHAPLTRAALDAGKAVFVEKPPCLTEVELERLEDAVARSGLPFAVGFNRRHAPLARAMKDHLSGHGPVQMLFRVAAGPLPAGHWLNDLDDGGGRLLGEGCHFVDFACWLVGGLPERVSCTMRPEAGEPLAAAQTFAVTLDFPDGSLATIAYFAASAPRLAKEYVEAHSSGRSAVLDDFSSLTLMGGGKRSRAGGRSRDKGHREQFAQLRALVEGHGAASTPSPLDTMGVTLRALRAAQGANA
jgi:predicted dehydrogenase/threonine dehydrogenase-like Zn-dependent dehydrogenase